MDAPSKIGTTDELKKVGQWSELGPIRNEKSRILQLSKRP